MSLAHHCEGIYVRTLIWPLQNFIYVFLEPFRGGLAGLYEIIGPALMCTSCALSLLHTYKYTACVCPLSPRDRRVSHFAPFPAAVHPRYVLLPSLPWDELHSRPDSQSGITSWKCRLRGRLQGFRVQFGAGPLSCFARPDFAELDVFLSQHILLILEHFNPKI